MIGVNSIDNFSPTQNNINNTLGYYDNYEEEEEVLNDNEQAALVPMEQDKVLCVNCNKILGNMRSAKRHFVAFHQKNQKARCQICQKIYKNVNTRNAHMLSMHGVSARLMKNAVSMDTSQKY